MSTLDHSLSFIDINDGRFGIDIIEKPTGEGKNVFLVGDLVSIYFKGDCVQDDCEKPTHIGIIVGFTPFKELPEIEIIYIQHKNDVQSINYLVLDSGRKDVDIVPFNSDESFLGEADVKNCIVKEMGRDIDYMETNLNRLKRMRSKFIDKFLTHENK